MSTNWGEPPEADESSRSGPPPPGTPGPPADLPPPPPAPSGYGQPQPAGYGYPAASTDFGHPGAAPQALASYGLRVGALLLDGLFYFAAGIALFVVTIIASLVLGIISETLAVIVRGILFTLGYVAILVTVMLMEAGPYGQTPGKHVVGIRVVKASGRMLSKGEAVGRYFAKWLSALPFYLGYLWPLWDDQNRTFHDMILDTRVVTAQDRAPSLLAVIRAPFTGSRAG